MLAMIVELCANLFDAALGTCFVLLFCKGRFQEHKVWTIVTTLLCFGVSTAYLFISDFSYLQSVIIFCILLFYAFRLKKAALLSKILAPVIFELALIGVNTTMMMLFSSLFNQDLSVILSEISAVRYMCMLSCKIILTFILLIILRFFTARSKFRVWDLVLYFISPVFTVFVLYTFMKICIAVPDRAAFEQHVIVSIVGLFLYAFVPLILFLKLSKSLQEQYELSFLNRQMEFQRKKYTEFKDLYFHLNEQRHDFKNQLLAMNQLLEEGKTDEVRQMIQPARYGLDQPLSYIHTGNPFLDYILNVKISGNPKVKFIVTGNYQELSGMSDTDIAVLFGNLIDNALEASEKCDMQPIELQFFSKGGYQNIICKNPIPESVLEKNPRLLTSKQEKSMHGFGIKSMRKMVEEKGGMMDIYEEDHKFCVHLMLQK